jgi:outer membrane biosynthesis protein TonB
MGKDSALRASQVIWRTVVLSGAMLGGACGGSAPSGATTPEPAMETTTPADQPVVEEAAPSVETDPLTETETIPEPSHDLGPPMVTTPVEAPAPPPPPEPTKAVTKKKKPVTKKPARSPDKDDSSDPCTGGESRVRGTEEDGPPRGRGFVLA